MAGFVSDLRPNGQQALDDRDTNGEQRQRDAEEQQNLVAGDRSEPRTHPCHDLANR